MLALAPMQDVTDLPFWKLMTAYGGADVYFTEYFLRSLPHPLSEKYILKSITENPTDRPVVAQMIGNDISFRSCAPHVKLRNNIPSPLWT